MKNYEVKVLKPGYAIWVGPAQQRADGTITLVTGQKNIIVDTGDPWDKQTILKALRKEKVHPQDFDFVICTHGHCDHTGNNNLFPNAIFIVSYAIWKRDLCIFHDFASGQPYKIGDEIEVIATPGHSKQDVSVVVRTPQGIVAIVGDLFENENDLEDESVWRAFSEFPEEHEISRRKILEVADFIVPGHGDIFKVRKGKGGDTISILFLAADPTDVSRLRLGEELREIQEKLQLAKLREQFVLQQRTSIRPADISQALLDVQPQIVHFSGHGMVSGALCFENQVGETQPIQPNALAALFEQFANQVNCVILNACYSETQAKAIAQHVDYVIGMSQAIGDKAAVSFAIGFYQALGAGRTIEDAYKLGCVQIRLQSIPEHLTPVLIKKGQVHS